MYKVHQQHAITHTQLTQAVTHPRHIDVLKKKNLLLVAAAPRDVTLDPKIKSDEETPKLKEKTCSHLGQLVVPTRATFFAQKHAVMHSFSCSFEMKAKIQHPQSPPPKRCILHQNPGVAPHKIANSQGHGKVVIYAQEPSDRCSSTEFPSP